MYRVGYITMQKNIFISSDIRKQYFDFTSLVRLYSSKDKYPAKKY